MTARRLDLKARLDALVARADGVWTAEACGVTRSGTPIPALVHRDAYSDAGDKTRVLLVGGLSGRSADVESALSALESYADSARDDRLGLSAVPCANPDGLRLNAAPGNGAGGFPDRGYPPGDGYFDHATDPEARYLWRWACFQGPDLVLEVRDGPSVSWEANGAAPALAGPPGAGHVDPADSLIAALAVGSPSGLTPAPGVRLTAPRHALHAELERLWSALSGTRIGPSPAGRALEARRGRSPIDVARVLASAYGHTLSPVVYTQGVAISGRLRLAELDPEGYDPVQDIASMVEPLVSTGNDPFGDEPGTPDLAGLLWGDELTRATGDGRYAGLVVDVADRYVPAAAGEAPPPSDPDFRTEDMFMNGAMLGRAFAITGDRRHIDMLTRFLLDAGVQQDDGLFWHCRSAPYYWGRGNGFAAMGFAETLTYLPEDHPDRDALLDIHRRHLRALGRLQSASGMFRQVLDFPGSYQELTATCMVGYAAARGLRRGWLDASYREMLDGCWRAASERVQDDGKIVDGCAGTGVQSSLREYLDRPAIHGFDDRTGSMAIWFATEMERLHRQAG